MASRQPDAGLTVISTATPASLLAQLSALGIHPKKGLGQNFLVDPSHRARIVAAAGLTPDDTVLEVGPGPGVLTELIAAQAGRVIAVELDDRLIPYLRERFADQPHVRIVHGDILKVDVGKLISESATQRVGESAESDTRTTHHASRITSYKVVANLPYYITSAAIRHLLESTPPPELLVLTVQREVAERMVAAPPEMSLLALGVQFYCAGRIVGRIPAGVFYPVPKVDSAVVRLDRRVESAVPGVTSEAFFRVARAGFSQPRKQLRNSLASGMGVAPARAEAWLTAAGIAPQRRAETLTVAEWGGSGEGDRAQRIEPKIMQRRSIPMPQDTLAASSSLPNIPWQDRPEASSDVVWRYSENPIIQRNATPTSNSVFNSAVVPFGNHFAGVFRCDSRARRDEHPQRLQRGWRALEDRPGPIAFICDDPEIRRVQYRYDPRVLDRGPLLRIVVQRVSRPDHRARVHP